MKTFIRYILLFIIIGLISGCSDVSTDTDYYLGGNQETVIITDPNMLAKTFYRWKADQGVSWFDFVQISDLHKLSDGSLWGFSHSESTGGQPTSNFKLLDVEGNKALKVFPSKDVTQRNIEASKIPYKEDTLYYIYAGEEPGTHRIGALDLQGDFIDITGNVDDLEFMAIYDYSISPDYV